MTADRGTPRRTKRPAAPGRGKQKMAIVHLVAEYWPYARTGGLAEAVRGIATYEAKAGIPTAVIMPLYRQVRERFPEIEPFGGPFTVQVGHRVEEARMYQAPPSPGEPRVLFVENDYYFDRDGIYGDENGDFPDYHRRFALFCRASLAALPRIAPEPPIVHAHDWHTVLAPIYLRNNLSTDGYYGRVPAILSVHNAAYQGLSPEKVLDELGLAPELFHWKRLEWHGHVNLLKGGLVYSDLVTTVSPGHAHELRTPAGGFGLHEVFLTLQDRFRGIINGIDQDIWNPETDPDIEANFTAEDLSGKAVCKAWLQEACGLPIRPDVPILCMSARLVHQKGLDLILGADILTGLDAQFIFLGEGEERYQRALAEFAARAPDRIVVRFDFTEDREHQLLAGADLLLMPSLYEPCGLTQMRAQRYGALPIARNVGGLRDTIEDQVTGFLFDGYDQESFTRAVERAVDQFNQKDTWVWHVTEAMGRDFSWEKPVEEYLRAYREAQGYHSELSG
jgi:starch synthase